jgi:hypothetical protein
MDRKGEAMTDQKKAELEERMQKELICQKCHRGEEIIVDGKSEISGHLFCPEGQKMLKKEEAIERESRYFCPSHDGELVDIDEIAARSAEEPKNEYCLACHPIDDKLRGKHKKAESTVEDTSMENCMTCHTSHSRCGGCHF